MASSARENLIEAAIRVFGREGFNATGIERLITEAGVARQTLYHHFRSKDELILAALRRRDEKFRASFARGVESRADDPAGRLLAMFDVLREWFRTDDFRGCLFLNVCAEFGEAEHPAHAAACEHKRLLRGYVLSLVRAAMGERADDEDAERAGALADELCLLMEGAMAQAQVTCACAPAGVAQRAAASLLRGAGVLS